MNRFLKLSSSAEAAKWCACVLLLLLPGSFIVLPMIWIARRWRLAAGG